MLTREAGRLLGFDPAVVFDGPVDSTVPEDVADELLATLREALANVARHAQARRTDVTVSVGRDLTLSVADDGVGPGDDPAGGHGIRNMRARAERLGGALDVDARDGGGCIVTWRVPLLPSPPP